MKNLLNFISDNSTQIWTLLSVMIGGVATYISTSATEKRKNKRQIQRERLETILIPYCTCVEETIQELYKIYSNYRNGLYEEENFKQWWKDLNKPLTYLYASKRIYLSEKSRNLLVEYEIMLNDFEKRLENECDWCLVKYKKHLLLQLEDFTNLGYSMWIECSMDKMAEYKVKLAIVNKIYTSLLNNIKEVTFIHNDDFENHRETSIKINNTFRNTLGAIKCGVMDWDDIENSEEELCCILLDFIYNKFTDENEVLMKIVDDTSSGDLLREILEKIENIRNQLIKEIDKITEL